MVRDLRLPIFCVLNFAIICLSIAVAWVIDDINIWRSAIVPTIKDPQHAGFILSNYITLPAIHLVCSFIVLICSSAILIYPKGAITSLTIALGFTFYLTDVIIMPLYFLLILPSPKYDGCYYWFTLPGAITNDQAAHGCHLLTGPLYVATVMGLCVMAIVAFMWIPILKYKNKSSQPPTSTIPPPRYPTGVELDARADAHTETIVMTSHQDTSKDDTSRPASRPMAPTISNIVNVPSEKDDADDVILDGAA